MGQPKVPLGRPKVQLDQLAQPKVLWVCALKGRILEQMLLLAPRFRPEMSKKELIKGTIHKRRLLRGVGRWGPPKGDLRRRGVDTLILVKETSPFLVPKKLPGQ